MYALQLEMQVPHARGSWVRCMHTHPHGHREYEHGATVTAPINPREHPPPGGCSAVKHSWKRTQTRRKSQTVLCKDKMSLVKRLNPHPMQGAPLAMAMPLRDDKVPPLQTHNRGNHAPEPTPSSRSIGASKRSMHTSQEIYRCFGFRKSWWIPHFFSLGGRCLRYCSHCSSCSPKPFSIRASLSSRRLS